MHRAPTIAIGADLLYEILRYCFLIPLDPGPRPLVEDGYINAADDPQKAAKP
jgi:hypothetical protein